MTVWLGTLGKLAMTHSLTSPSVSSRRSPLGFRVAFSGLCSPSTSATWAESTANSSRTLPDSVLPSPWVFYTSLGTQVLLCTGCTYTSVTLYRVYLHKYYSVQGVLTQVLLCTGCTYTSITLYKVYLHKYYSVQGVLTQVLLDWNS